LFFVVSYDRHQLSRLQLFGCACSGLWFLNLGARVLILIVMYDRRMYCLSLDFIVAAVNEDYISANTCICIFIFCDGWIVVSGGLDWCEEDRISRLMLLGLAYSSCSIFGFGV